MKKATNKLVSFLAAFAMVLGVLVGPFTSANAAEAEPTPTITKEDMVGDIKPTDLQKDKPESTNLTIHKLVADDYKEGVPVDHNGGTLTQDQLGKLGTNVKGLSGVKFTIYEITGEETFKTIKETKPKTTEAMQTYVTAGQATLVTADGLTAGQTESTDADGEVSVNLPDGNYWVVESERPSSVTESLAVPFAITLPLLNQVKVDDNAPGTMYMKNVHVYPKNTSEKPQMDKYFGDRDPETDSSKLTEDHQLHPDYEKYLEKKETIDARIGSKVPYEVKTSLKAGQKYSTLSWSDIMTTGLKYNNDLTVTYRGSDNQDVTVNVSDDDSKDENDYGFDFVIRNKETIQKINEALESGDVEVTLKYTATMTRDAVVDLPESNNITFTPGEPKHKNNNEPVKPEDGEITVFKNWADGKPEKGVLVTYILFEEGKPVASVTLKGEEIQSTSLPEGVTVDNNSYNVTFKGLDNNKTYKVEEFADGYDPQYEEGNLITNKPNPDTITPTPPQVVTYGKKFVKTNKDGKERLAGAEFVVKNAKGDGAKYLVAKSGDQVAEEVQNVKEAKTALDEAIDKYNQLEKTAQTPEEKKKIDDLQIEYNDAVKAAGNIYSWGEKKDAIVLVSDGNGKFEITGLPEGTYYLEETKSPKGFAKLTDDVEFSVNKDSYKNGGDKAIDYVLDSNKKDAQQVENKDLTIPQTGGIGSLIFIVAGIALMGVAIAMKRRNSYEEA